MFSIVSGAGCDYPLLCIGGWGEGLEAEYVHASEVRQRLNEYRLEVLPDRVEGKGLIH
jgi:hypothetical protein